MRTINSIKKILKPRLKLVRGTKLVSFLFIGTSILIAAGILFAANMYYNIDTGEVVTEQIQRVTGVLRATAGVIVGGTATQNPTAGFVFEVVGQTKLATTTIDTTGQLRFSGSDTYAGFGAPSSYATGTPMVYKLPQHGSSPPVADYVLTWQSGNQLQWKEIAGVGGVGDITAVGDVTNGAAFTGTQGNILYFEGTGAGAGDILLTGGVAPSSNVTVTIPGVAGTLALGTSTANYVAYWDSGNVLRGEAQLATSRGGTGQNTSNWSGMLKVSGGTWTTTTGTTNYAAYWSDANTVAAEQFLGVSRGGTGRGSWTQWGVLYADTTGSLINTAAGSADYMLVGAGSGAPTWKYIGQLLTAGSNISLSGTTNVTIATVMNPTFATSVTSPQFLSTTTLAIISGDGQNITINPASGRIVLASGDFIQTASGYDIGRAGTEVLREMIPVFGFDLPAQTATTSYVRVSRTIDAYPFSLAATGTTRVHRFVIRYTDNLPLASTTDWRVATTSGAYSPFTLPGRNNSALDSGWATTTTSVTVPTDTPWWLEVRSKAPYDTYKVKIFQIFLAAYDQIQ